MAFDYDPTFRPPKATTPVEPSSFVERMRAAREAPASSSATLEEDPSEKDLSEDETQDEEEEEVVDTKPVARRVSRNEDEYDRVSRKAHTRKSGETEEAFKAREQEAERPGGTLDQVSTRTRERAMKSELARGPGSKWEAWFGDSKRSNAKKGIVVSAEGKVLSGFEAQVHKAGEWIKKNKVPLLVGSGVVTALWLATRSRMRSGSHGVRGGHVDPRFFAMQQLGMTNMVDRCMQGWNAGNPSVIAQVQSYLGVPADGYIGYGTVAAIQLFQSQLGFAATGTMDFTTMFALLGG